MDNNNNGEEKNKGLLRLMFPILVVVFGLIAYFIYQGFFAGVPSELTSATNEYLVGTRLGKDVDIINKENLSFSTNINNKPNTQDRSTFEVINPSQQVGRANPFLP